MKSSMAELEYTIIAHAGIKMQSLKLCSMNYSLNKNLMNVCMSRYVQHAIFIYDTLHPQARDVTSLLAGYISWYRRYPTIQF